ncbi:uncharacterized protein LOC124270039 isoform X1 [Haliotis rubra]|uniref:uncharacterized protein LOC124270039 isoform X1 n=2 Tax=Haliotis rubra TaxID=36100 RepID=UPI001EE51C22|nr:uncharacterized protein LOC124270039 isoform X1 [Haliotis rubra]
MVAVKNTLTIKVVSESCIRDSLLEPRMANRPGVSVRPLGGSRYLVIYEIGAANQEPTSAEATVNSSSVVKFRARVGSREFHHVSHQEPAGITIIEQKTVHGEYVVTVECPVDPTDKFQ